MLENPIEKDRGWLLPATKTENMRPGLYLVATPIGNLRDISFRALDTLAQADVVLCEDTRVSGKLLLYYGIKKKLEVYNDHSDAHKRQSIVQRIKAGGVFVLISDAGTPLISDPGYKLVQALREAGGYITTIPGANAPLSALQLSGLPSDAFSFLGFLPPKSSARQKFLSCWLDVPATLMAFETAPRLVRALGDIAALMPKRIVVVAREITKLFEEVRISTADELITHYNVHGLPKGEIVILIAPPAARELSEVDLRLLLKESLKTMGTKDAAALVSEKTGTPRKRLYQLALEIAGS